MGIEFCSISIFSKGQKSKSLKNGITFPEMKLLPGIEEMIFGYGEHVGGENTEVVKESEKMYWI